MKHASLIIVLILVHTSLAQGTAVIQEGRAPDDALVISTDNWDPHSSFELWTISWRFHSGDDSAWADLRANDSEWQRVRPNLRPGQFSPREWHGVGWFRLHIRIEEPIDRILFGIRGGHAGAIQVYWDGSLVADSVHYRIPISILSDRAGDHVLAVRLATDDIEALHAVGSSAGFYFWLEDYAGAIDLQMRQLSEQMFFTAFLLAFAILHLMLYMYAPSSYSNLYYTIFLVFTAATIYVDIEQSYLSSSEGKAHDLLIVHRALVPFASIFFLRFLYSVFYPAVPRQFWFFVVLMLLAGSLIVTAPTERYDYYVYASTLVTAEMVRVLILATRRKNPGAWTFAVGFILVALFSAYDTALDLRWMDPIAHVTNAYYFGFFGMMIAMSVHLARDYARTSTRLVEQMKRTQEEELARRLVEADNVRKTAELEDARQLQVSMLPACSNDIPGIDICFHMKTATEVGGDYYDYRVADDGSLIVAVGDATGHGMKAGIMVSIVKGLFITHRSFETLSDFLDTCSAAIREMRLGNLFMGLSVARFSDDRLSVASAGMPPLFLHRAGTSTVEEILMKSMPLGGPSTAPYEEGSIDLRPGDSVLMMSDGMAESFDDRREMFDYHRIKELFLSSCSLSATEIVHTLEQAVMRWRGDREQTDDITIVVVKKVLT